MNQKVVFNSASIADHFADRCDLCDGIGDTHKVWGSKLSKRLYGLANFLPPSLQSHKKLSRDEIYQGQLSHL